MQFVTDALAAGKRATRTRSDAWVLRGQGKTHRVLVDAGGSLTKFGRYYETQTGETLERDRFNPDQAAEREGNTETIRLRGGGRGVVRSFDPAALGGQGKWRYTALGRAYFDTKRISYLVRVPATFHGTNARGKSYKRRGFFPISEPIQLPLSLSQTQRDKRIRQAINDSIGEDGVLAEYSQESVRLRRGEPWQIVEMVTQTGGAGDPVSDVRERPLGSHPARFSDLPFVEAITPAAFACHRDKLCSLRQLVEITDLCEQELRGLLADVCGPAWTQRGVTSTQLFELARLLDKGAVCLHGHRIVSTQPGPDPIVWNIWEGHLYAYADPSVCQKLARRVESLPRELIKQPLKRKHCDVTMFEGTVEPGDFWVPEEEIDTIRECFLRQRRHPKVTLKNAFCTKRLTYTFTRGEEHSGTCKITAWPEEGPLIAEWYEALRKCGLTNLSYQGQGLASATHEALLRALKFVRERVWLDPDQRHEVLERHNYECALCGARGGHLQMDHIVRLSQSFCNQSTASYQPLCPACHLSKSQTEPQEYDDDPLASAVNTVVAVDYVQSARPPALVQHFSDADPDVCQIADVIRCRKRALEFSEHELPVLCIYDDIHVRTAPELGDLNFVTKPAGCVKELLGHTGPGWQHRVQTQFLLSQGVLEWEDISHTLTATGRLPRDLLREPFRILEDAWPDAWGRKECFNALTGLFTLDECHKWNLVTSAYSADAPDAALRRHVHFGDGYVTDHISKQSMRTIHTHRPLHDLCLCTEAALVGNALAMLRASGAVVHEIKTDSLLWSGGDAVDLTALRRSGEPIWRQAPAQASDLMRTRPKMPARDGWCAGWSTCWVDLTEEQAREHVLEGGSLYVEGIAGSGKSHFVASLAKALADSGRSLARVSKTHCASARIGGVTADHWVRRHVLNGAVSAQVLWIDEVFQTECSLMTQLAKLPHRVAWIMSGDPEQFGPVHDSWRGCHVKPGAFQNSTFFGGKCGGYRLRLTACRRSDTQLFEYYSSLIRGGSRFQLDLREVLADARQRFVFDGPARHNVCVSHRHRKKLNAQLGNHFKPAGARYLKGSSPHEESTWVYPGAPLIGCSSGQRSKIQNNVTYEVAALTEGGVALVGGARLTDAQVLSWTRPAWARTIASIQGTEFDEELRIWDTRNPHFTMKHLYVCLSRAKDCSKLHVT